VADGLNPVEIHRNVQVGEAQILWPDAVSDPTR
jgi:hypothetical protein